MSRTALDPDALAQVLRDERADYRALLTEWVSIPSVAGMPEHAGDLRRSAQWLVRACREVGFPEAEILPTGESFAVRARWAAADPEAPTVLVYSHHDVRAAKAEQWSVTSPFQPVLRDGRLYGRGASDAKGQALAHVRSVAALLAATGLEAPAVTLVLLFEGEEELGSPGLSALLTEHYTDVRPDVVVFSDTLQWRAGEPAMCTSVRGMLPVHVEVRGTLHDVHSGAVSGAAPNAALALADVLARLHDAEGRIALPGFSDTIPEITEQRRAELAALTYSEADWLRRSHTRVVGGEPGYSVLERLWERPALEVVGLLAGDPTGMPRAVIPSGATADISIRTVPGQSVHEAGEQLRAFVRDALASGLDVEVSVSDSTAQEGYRTPWTWCSDALERAMRRGYGVTEVKRMGNAGGGPAELLARRFEAPVLFFGTGLPEDNWHDSDESADLDELLLAVGVLAHLWVELADRPAAEETP
ncbi:M20/M25/M40 family metallo-hydrolase [Rathayibacter sp. VKM Ac-2857]|uniref:M20/M25/M40 family metallo-hydrolase n=1 Tax=Rathayibacter sp. VKM Ac-2857 TaxID=2739020 RepID=UPI001564BCF6|nr:M20/M25/M40 family metallo-hydrolase [Rathayibacter sp. VKM Ac-2857]NQX17290.1 M20/M25/M40 family metallo-hydrolase [Rathayibacter sp. VKM Ac-2857]